VDAKYQVTMWYDIKLIREKETPKGELKQVCESYLFNAELVSESEAKALEEYPDCEVVCVARSKIVEIVNENIREGAFYKAKVTETTVNEDGSESSRSYLVLCNAESLPKATTIFQEYLRQGLENMELQNITKTKIIDIL